MNVLFIVNDQEWGKSIQRYLEGQGFYVDLFTESQAGCAALGFSEYEAAVIDFFLPEHQGMKILTAWRRARYDLPVLVLTDFDRVEERIESLNGGADDCLSKPFSLVELTARLNALIRRSRGHSSTVLSHGGVSLNLDTRSITRNGNRVEMSPKETLLVNLFLMNKNKVLDKREIEKKMYAWDEDVFSNTVEVYIHHIRRKLGKNFISTVRGQGYILGSHDDTEGGGTSRALIL